MLKGISIDQRVEYSSPTDTGDVKTVFVLRPLSGAEMFDLFDITTGALKLDSVGVKALLNKAVVEVRDFDGETNVSKIIDMLPTRVLIDLVTETSSLNTLDGEEAKN